MPSDFFYRPQGPFTVRKILEHIGCKYEGRWSDLPISNINSLLHAEKEDLSFCYIPKKKEELRQTKASICLVTPEIFDPSFGDRVIKVDDARGAHGKIAQLFYPNFNQFSLTTGRSYVEPTAFVHPSAQIGAGVRIGSHSHISSNVVLGDGVQIGSDTSIHPNVTIASSIIGNHVAIHSGASIGEQGFGFAITKEGFIDIPHLGCVEIKDHVRIGCNTTIDRGVLENTIIGEWTRIDNLVQIGHNVILGKNCVIVSQTGIAGSTVVGDGTMFGGQVGVADHLSIGKNVKVAAQGGVSKNLEDGIIVAGSPAVPIKDWHKQVFLLNKLIKKKE